MHKTLSRIKSGDKTIVPIWVTCVIETFGNSAIRLLIGLECANIVDHKSCDSCIHYPRSKHYFFFIKIKSNFYPKVHHELSY